MIRKYMRFPGGKAKALTLSYDDGSIYDLRLIELMKQNGIKGTFNLNSTRLVSDDYVHPEGKAFWPMKKNDVYEAYTNEYCSVSTHSAHHPTLLNASETEIADEFLSDRIALEKLFKRIIKGHAIPNGPYNQTTLQVGELCGLKYMRSIEDSFSYEFPESFIPWRPTCAVSDQEVFSLADEFLSKTPTEEPYLFYVWGHTHFLEARGQWDMMDRFIKQVAFKDDVWYATNDEICDYTQKFNWLEFSADGKNVFNPSDTPIWFMAVGKMHCVEPNESITL